METSMVETTSLLSKHSLSFLLPLILVFSLLLFKWLNLTPKNLPPSPPKLPIIGNLHQLGSNPQRSLKSLAEKYGRVMLLHMGSKTLVVISSSQAAEEVLKTHDLVFASRPQTSFGRRLLYNFKDVTFAPYSEYWRQVRSICVLQLLSNKRVQSFRSVREEEIALMVEKITESCSSSSIIHIGTILSTLTNNIVSRVTIGKRFSGEKVGSQFKDLFEEYTTLLGVFNVGDYIPWLGWINHLNGLDAKVSRVARELDEYLENLVEEGKKRQSEIRKGDQGQQTFMDVLLQLQQGNAPGFALDRDSIKAIILTMFVGGTDTTSALLEWAIAELLRNKNAETRLKNEVRQFSRRKSEYIITEDDLEHLPYLKAVVKESLRMHPSIPLIPRVSSKTVKIQGYDIADGTEVIVNAFAIGRDGLAWEDADEFKPERFLNSSIDTKGQHFMLIPFGSGRRSCPGIGFASVTAEIALANLMLRFDFGLAEGRKPEELDMTEAPGAVTQKKIPLLLVATLPN